VSTSANGGLTNDTPTGGRTDPNPDRALARIAPLSKKFILINVQGGLPQQITVLVVTGIAAVRLVTAWTNPGLKGVPGVAQVLASVRGLARRWEVKTKAFDSAPVWLPAGRCFVGQFVLGYE